MKKLISIIIPTFSRNKLLIKLLDSIIENPFFDNSFEVIVVDNNKNLDFFELSKQYKQVTYVFEPKSGVSYARNSGVEHSNGTYLYFLDDEIIDLNTLNEIKKIVLNKEREKDNYIYIGKTTLKYESRKQSFINSKLENYLSKIDYGPKEKILNKKEWITAGNLLIKKSIFNKINGFNTELQRTSNNLMGNEDIILKKKCEDINIKTKYIPTLNVFHFVPTERMSEEWFLSRAFNQGKSNYLFNEMFKENTNLLLLKKLIEKLILKILSKLHYKKDNRFFYKVIHESRRGFFDFLN